MESYSENTRQAQRCGYLPVLPHATLPTAHMEDGPLQDLDDVCAGFHMNQPDVAEAMMAHAWWVKGQLRDLCEGQPPAVVIEAVTIFANACGQLEEFINRRAREEMDRGPR